MIKSKMNKKVLNNVTTFALVGVLLLMLFNPGAKAWVLRQLLHTGLYTAEIKKEEKKTTDPVATNFSYRDAKGNEVSTEDLKGKVVFINFWASWCPPCRAEMPGLNQLFKEFENDNRIVFLFLAEDDDVSKAKLYLQNNNFSIPLMQRTSTLPTSMYSGTLPTTIIIDQQGRMAFRHEGLAKYDSKGFVEQLKKMVSDER